MLINRHIKALVQPNRTPMRAVVNLVTYAAALTTLALTLVQNAAASMTAANQPAAIGNPGVKAGIDRESRESYEVALTFALICPGKQPQTVPV